MRVQRYGILVLVASLGVIAGAGAGCGQSSESGSGGASASSSTSSTMSVSSTSSGSTGMTSSSSSASSSSTGSSSSTTSSSSGAGGGSPGHCKKGCANPADCCPPGIPNCPSNMYPTNYTCTNGACGPPQCSVKADCTFGGQLPQYDCLIINALHACVVPCTLDADCSAAAKCVGVADNMQKYCKIDMPPFMCMGPADCAGIGQCVNGDCVCFGPADCTDPNANFCAK